jgi:hypothetical protein
LRRKQEAEIKSAHDETHRPSGIAWGVARTSSMYPV